MAMIKLILGTVLVVYGIILIMKSNTGFMDGRSIISLMNPRRQKRFKRFIGISFIIMGLLCFFQFLLVYDKTV
ncbi:hypothetical protein C8Z91_01200 [Paenibacillus elgii]|uniref:Uncharacterized protein n=1 Tax=Paenibacillus elgii TaxID=189691 RepID=A0A2T6GA52_9BACL|nr:hypothetical protein C8Z91_01200 [Paenibacillus elgii]